jgi:hypothetical protein
MGGWDTAPDRGQGAAASCIPAFLAVTGSALVHFIGTSSSQVIDNFSLLVYVTIAAT